MVSEECCSRPWPVTPHPLPFRVPLSCHLVGQNLRFAFVLANCSIAWGALLKIVYICYIEKGRKRSKNCVLSVGGKVSNRLAASSRGVRYPASGYGHVYIRPWRLLHHFIPFETLGRSRVVCCQARIRSRRVRLESSSIPFIHSGSSAHSRTVQFHVNTWTFSRDPLPTVEVKPAVALRYFL